MAMLTRLDLQAMATQKAEDAELLYQHSRYANAYYLFGYAAELGLKACVARLFVADAIPDRKFSQGVFTHRLDDLVSLAGLRRVLDAEIDASPDFAARWRALGKWSEDARYASFDRLQCETIRDSICHDQFGILQWLRRHW